jgi:hypothetical protein
MRSTHVKNPEVFKFCNNAPYFGYPVACPELMLCMLTRHTSNTAHAFKFHSLNPPTISSYLNCLKNITYITGVTKIATWFKCTAKVCYRHNKGFSFKYV